MTPIRTNLSTNERQTENRLATLEQKWINLAEMVLSIKNNNLPHIQDAIDRLDNKIEEKFEDSQKQIVNMQIQMSRWIGIGGTILFIIQILIAYAIKKGL